MIRSNTCNACICIPVCRNKPLNRLIEDCKLIAARLDFLAETISKQTGTRVETIFEFNPDVIFTFRRYSGFVERGIQVKSDILAGSSHMYNEKGEYIDYMPGPCRIPKKEG